MLGQLSGSHRPGDIVNDVLIGNGGHLFLAGGAHKVLDYVSGKVKPSQSSIDTFRGNLIQREKLSIKRKIEYVHVIFPDKQSILVDAFPFKDPVCLGSNYQRECGLSEDLLLYPIDGLRSIVDPYKKTDTHASDAGIVLVVSKIMDRFFGDTFTKEYLSLSQGIMLEKEETGDLGAKFRPSLSSTEKFLSPYWKFHLFSNRLSRQNGLVDIWCSESSLTDKRILIFGDSFGRGMARILSRFFRVTVFLRTPHYHVDLVDQIRPDFVITQNVERYLSMVPHDGKRPSFHMYPFLGGCPDLAFDAGFAEAFSAILSYPRHPYLDFMRKLAKAA